MAITRNELLELYKKYAPNEYREIMKADKLWAEDHLDFLCSGYSSKEAAEKRLKEAAEEGLID